MLFGDVTKKGKLLIYTRQPEEEAYGPGLAHSVHLAYSPDGKYFTPLNRNYGVLFASATIHQPDTLVPMGLKAPYLFRTAEGEFGIVAVRILQDGSPDPESRGKILLWASRDLIHFTEKGLVDLGIGEYVLRCSCEYDPALRQYRIRWQSETGAYYENLLKSLGEPFSVSAAAAGSPLPTEPAGGAFCGLSDILPGNMVEVDASFGERLCLRMCPLENVSLQAPETVYASSPEELAEITASAFYTDGSSVQKRVEWDASSVDFTKPGAYRAAGKAIQKEFPFPLAKGYADPDILKWEGKYYFLATNDNVNDIGLFVREAPTVEELFTEESRSHEKIILNVNEEKDFMQTFWAPEFHVIGGRLYILFAVSGKKWGPQCHIMRLKEGGNILRAEDWEEPVRVRRRNGSPLAGENNDITLDMTHFSVAGKDYLAWSYRKWIGKPEDSGSMIYIATTNPEEPWNLASEPVLLTSPLYGWENHRGTINNEGPNAFIAGGNVYLTYSGGAAGGYSYVIGMLTAALGSDLLDPNSWVKNNAPVMSYVSGVFGPGHNSFYTDEDGNLMVSFHGEENLVGDGGPRCTGIRRVHFDVEGSPRFDMTPAQDLNPAHTEVETTVLVSKRN